MEGLGTPRDNGKENGNYRDYWGYRGVLWGGNVGGYIGIRGVLWGGNVGGYTGIMEKNMEITGIIGVI